MNAASAGELAKQFAEIRFLHCYFRLWLKRLTANAKVATVLGSIPESSDTVESEVQQKKQC